MDYDWNNVLTFLSVFLWQPQLHWDGSLHSVHVPERETEPSIIQSFIYTISPLSSFFSPPVYDSTADCDPQSSTDKRVGPAHMSETRIWMDETPAPTAHLCDPECITTPTQWETPNTPQTVWSVFVSLNSPFTHIHTSQVTQKTNHTFAQRRRRIGSWLGCDAWEHQNMKAAKVKDRTTTLLQMQYTVMMTSYGLTWTSTRKPSLKVTLRMKLRDVPTRNSSPLPSDTALMVPYWSGTCSHTDTTLIHVTSLCDWTTTVPVLATWLIFNYTS